MRVSFNELFRNNGDGSFTPKKVVKIGGVTMRPEVFFRCGEPFCGVDLVQYLERDINIEETHDGIIEIKGVY